ncbi:MAG: DNA topoisomerase IB [Actinobacteria bacterium]|nr:DNA topoisomerase IB [Actinomycetota bacterium]
MLTRTGRKGAFRYVDAKGREVRDEETLERIAKLAIPPAWKGVEIAAGPRAKLQATGVDAAGRKQYLYHPNFRAAQERAKFERLIRFGERLPELRTIMAEHLDKGTLDRERVTAIALRLIDLGWFRVGNDRHTQTSGTYGITTLRKRHVHVRGDRVRLSFIGKGRSEVRTSLVDDELATAVRELLAVPGGARLFRYERDDAGVCDLTSRVVNEYVKTYLGEEFTAKDFRTWGGTLVAAVAFAERVQAGRNGKGGITAVMRVVSERLGNTPAVCRQSYVAPTVVDAYLEGRTLADFRPRHLRKLGARQTGLEPEEMALIQLLNFR